MKNTNLPGFQELLDKTLAVAGLQGINLASCELLAFVISEQTRSKISAVTLQRLYGMIARNHYPSVYTLDTLSRFCGFKGWDDWCTYLQQSPTVLPSELLECRDFNKLFHSTNEPMWLFHTNSFRFLEVNDAAIHNYGYSRECFLEMSILDIRPSGDAEALRKEVEGAGDLCYHLPVFRHRLADGDLIDVRIISGATQLPEGNARLVMPIKLTSNLI